MVILVIGGFANLLQYPLIMLVFDYLDGSFRYVNFGFFIGSLSVFILPIYLAIQGVRVARQKSYL